MKIEKLERRNFLPHRLPDRDGVCGCEMERNADGRYVLYSEARARELALLEGLEDAVRWLKRVSEYGVDIHGPQPEDCLGLVELQAIAQQIWATQ